MTTSERIEYFTRLFDKLQSTTSILEKRAYVAEIPDCLQADWTMTLECLAGKHKFGYKFVHPWDYFDNTLHDFTTETIKDILDYLLEPRRSGDLSLENIRNHCIRVLKYEKFFRPIVDRTLKLGISNSALDKDNHSPMLAKKLEDTRYIAGKFTVTEKLDGNRCIAFYDGLQWNFVSRNGKPMNINFDMSRFPKDLVYDGEVLSPEQVNMSKIITQAIKYKLTDYAKFDKSLFNTTSGLINRHTNNKNLIYNIFDIQLNTSYVVRRSILNDLKDTVAYGDTRILPTLAEFNSFEELMENASQLLDTVTDIGGEGLMINNDNCNYEHNRTKAILKYKKVKTMDMIVTDVEYGAGKYEFAIGALCCKAYDPTTGDTIICKVGSGLSDEQRFKWYDDRSIIGKIVEVSYFDISDTGLKVKSLRFPRLKKVREDKITESIY